MEVIIKRKKMINFYILLLKSIIFFQIIILSFSETQNICEYDTPILRKGSSICIKEGCMQKDYQDDECSIENQKIKTQWLNGFRFFEDEYGDIKIDYTYIDIITSLNGKLIVFCNSEYDSDSIRLFYFLESNGRYSFKDKYSEEEQKEIPYLSYDLSKENRGDFTNIFSFKVNGRNMDNKEYLISISNNNDLINIYDIEGEYYNPVEINILFNIDNFKISSYVNTFFQIGNSNNYILAFIANNNEVNYFYLCKIDFSSYNFNGFSILNDNMKIFESSNAKIVSCFESDSKYLICFYQDRLYNYQEIVFDQNYVLKKNGTIVARSPDEDLDEEKYFEGVHFTEETAAFLYYNGSKPTIIFKKYNINEENIVNHFNSIEQIELNLTTNTDVHFNDLIKIDEFKICFTSVNEDKEDLYITIINNYDQVNEKIKIRYYIIHIKNLYLYQIRKGLSTTVYNGFISLASSFSEFEFFDDYCWGPSSIILLFSYPNSEDFTIDLNDEFIIDLNSKCKIENNIFGLVYNGIKLLNISEGYNLLSTKNGRELSIDDYIYEDEKIIVDLSNIANIPENGRIVFALELIEPSYDIYNDYAYSIQNIGDDTEESFFEPKTYIGRHSYCDIIKINDDSLADECEAQNCKLCLSNQTCILCEDNSKLSENGNTIICWDESSFQNEDSTVPDNVYSTVPDNVYSSVPDNPYSTVPDKIDSTVPDNVYSTVPNKIDSTTPDNVYSTVPNKIDSTIPDNVYSTISNNVYSTSPEIDSTIPDNIFSTVPNKMDSTIPDIEEFTIPKIIDSTIPENIDKETIINDNKKRSNCTIDEIKNNKCNGTITVEQIEEIKQDYLKSNGKNEIIKTEKVIIQYSTLEEQKDSENTEVSSIDLGECENILKDKYNIPKDESLIIFKLDIKTEDLLSTYVNYEIYSPTDLTKLNLDFCKDVEIIINTPAILDDSIELIYNSLYDSGYNLFDGNDSFYQDICADYTTINGTDIILSDRKNDLYTATQNTTICQTGCEFEKYNSKTKKAKCNCNIKNEKITDLYVDNLFDKKEIQKSFYDTLTNSNFRVLKCYELIISPKFIKNIGGIFMSIILIVLIALIFFSYTKGPEKIHYLINIVLKNLRINQNPNFPKIKNQVNKNQNSNKDISKNSQKKPKDKKKNKNYKKINSVSIYYPPRRIGKKSKTIVNKGKIAKKSEDLDSKSKLVKNNKKIKNRNKRKSAVYSLNNSNKMRSINDKKSDDKLVFKTNEKISENSIQRKSSSIYQIKNSKNKLGKKLNINNKFKNNRTQENLNDQELNTLEYEKAIIYDKRTYFQYYWSLLKKKHLIFFTFLPANDYNIYTIKISLFLLSFGLFFTINGFFFSDATMHKIYEDNGFFDILFQIPQILYSTVISAVINMILKTLSLSEKNVLDIKQEKDYEKAVEKSLKIEKCIKIKFFLFFFLSFSFMVFFWYFISCFCAVYTNTQIILIKDTLLSFGISLIYPFGLNLLPGMFRICALRAEKKDKKCLYKFSTIIALI